ncbi:MAG: ATP-binding protein [Egibacteraceae bacterium]
MRDSAGGCDLVVDNPTGRAASGEISDFGLPALLAPRRGIGGVLVEVMLPPTAACASHARRVVRDALPADLDEDDRDTVLVLVTELVANASSCADSPCELRVCLDDTGLLCVELADACADMPSVAGQDLDAERGSGRGLLLVEGLADTWGASVLPGGKVVWFSLRTLASRSVGPGGTRA